MAKILSHARNLQIFPHHCWFQVKRKSLLLKARSFCEIKRQSGKIVTFCMRIDVCRCVFVMCFIDLTIKTFKNLVNALVRPCYVTMALWDDLWEIIEWAFEGLDGIYDPICQCQKGLNPLISWNEAKFVFDFLFWTVLILLLIFVGFFFTRNGSICCQV